MGHTTIPAGIRVGANLGGGSGLPVKACSSKHDLVSKMAIIHFLGNAWCLQDVKCSTNQNVCQALKNQPMQGPCCSLDGCVVTLPLADRCVRAGAHSCSHLATQFN